MCFLNTTNGNINSQYRYTTTPFRSIYCTYGNNPSGQCGYSGSQQNTPVLYSNYFRRPNVKFGTATDGYASGFQWLPATGINAVADATAGTTTAHPQTDQWYIGRSTDSICVQMDSIFVRVAAFHTPQNVSICAGDSVLLSASHAASYAWIDASGLLSMAASFYYHPAHNSAVVLVMTDSLGGVHTDTSHITVMYETVWPGDINSDGVADYTDLLYLGQAYGAAGPVRPSASLVWSAQCAESWGPHLMTGPDYAHADADGDGAVTIADTLAISQNYGLVHPKTQNSRSSSAYLSITTDRAVYRQGDIINATVLLADSTLPVQHLYGISLEALLTSDAGVQTLFIDQTGSWIGPHIGMARQGTPARFAQTRMDQRDTTGHGSIAEISYRIAQAVTHWDSVTLTVTSALALTAAGDTIDIGSASKVVFIDNHGLGIPQTDISGAITIAPNPGTGLFHITMPHATSTEMTVTDAIGREVYARQLTDTRTDLDLSAVPTGVYTVHFTSGESQSSKRIIIAR